MAGEQVPELAIGRGSVVGDPDVQSVVAMAAPDDVEHDGIEGWLGCDVHLGAHVVVHAVKVERVEPRHGVLATAVQAVTGGRTIPSPPRSPRDFVRPPSEGPS
jgi:hypothetical protein